MSRVPAIVALRAFMSSTRDMNTSAERNERARLRRRFNLRAARLAANRRRNALAHVAHPLFVAGVMPPPPPPQQAPAPAPAPRPLPPSRLRAPLALLTVLHHRNHNLRGLDLGFLSLSLSTLLPPQPLADGDGSDDGYEPLPMMGQDDVAMEGMPEAKGEEEEEEKGKALAGVKEGSSVGGGLGGWDDGALFDWGGRKKEEELEDKKFGGGRGRKRVEIERAVDGPFAVTDDQWKIGTPAAKGVWSSAHRIDKYGAVRKPACQRCRRDHGEGREANPCKIWTAGGYTKCSWCTKAMQKCLD